MLEHVLRLVRSSIAVLVLVAVSRAQATPEPWRVLRDMEVVGVAAFDRDHIATALVADEMTMRLLQARLDEETAAAVANRVRELHRRGGYAKAEARGEVVEGALRVTLTPGTRFRAGPVRCSGNTLVATERIRDLLAASDHNKSVWVEGQFPVADAAVDRRVTDVVQNAYREVGRHGVRAKVVLVPADDRMVIDIAITDEGHELHIQSLRLEGEEQSQRDAVMAAVRFTPGMLVTRAAFNGLLRQFESTGRYLSVSSHGPDDGGAVAELPAVLDPLTIVVKVRPDAPAFGTVSLRDAEQLLKAIDTFLAHMKKGTVMCVAVELTEPATWGRFRLLPGTVTVHCSQDGIAIVADRLQWADAPAAKAVLHLVGDQLTFGLGERISSWHFAAHVGLQFSVLANFRETEGAQLRWGMGMSMHPSNDFVASIHPGIAAYTLEQASEVRRNGDELAIRFGDTTVRIAGDGEVVGQQVTVAEAKVTISLSRTPIPELRPRPAAGGVESEAGALLLEGAVAVATDAFATAGRDDARVPALMRGCLAAAASVPHQVSKPDVDVQMPSLTDGDSPSTEAMIATLASMPAVNRQCEGRIVELSAAFGSLLQHNTLAANAGFRAIAAHEPPCPLSLALAGLLHGMLGNERAKTRFCSLAAESWSFDGLYADAADLARNLEVLQPWATHIGARWREQPELKELFAVLPEGEAGNLAAWRKGLEVLWAAGGEAALRKLLLGK